MGGGLTISLARALPERVTAAASIHGAWLVRDTPDSPHRDLDGVRAEVHMAWCENDPTAPMSDLDVMRQALEDAGITYTLAVHDDAQHGRSEERRVGKECVSTCRSRGSPDNI